MDGDVRFPQDLHLLIFDVTIFPSVYKVRDYFNPDQGRSWNDKPRVRVLIPFLFHLSRGIERHEISSKLTK
jgi:hypothetical protein